MTVDMLIEELEVMYPNDILQLENLTEKERDAYIVRLNMIENIRKIGGFKDETK